MGARGLDGYFGDLVRRGQLAKSPTEKLYLAHLALQDVRRLEAFASVMGSPPRVVSLVKDLRAEVEARVRNLTPPVPHRPHH